VTRKICATCASYPQITQRNDLLFAVTNTTTFPGYGYFLEQVRVRMQHSLHLSPLRIQQPTHPPPAPPSLKGYTSWPEDWNTSQQQDGFLSKMHGCYNGIGLWFIEGLAGIAVDASADPPLSFRAAVEAGDIAWASGTRCVKCWRLDSFCRMLARDTSLS
jgi:hypothetical protein